MTLNNSPEHIVGILGSGYGLYGYVPAVALTGGNTIALLKKAEDKFGQRPELAKFKAKILWLDEGDFYKRIDMLIVCLSPEGQFSCVHYALAYPNIGYILLEKPLAANPEKSAELLNALIKSGRTYRIGYNFQYTTWGKALLAGFNDIIPSHIKIDWSFRAHHFDHDIKNWKRYHRTGGGVIRFYGIHLIALLAKAGSCRILSSASTGYSDDELYKWNAQVEINSIHVLHIEINSAAPVDKFLVRRQRSDEDDTELVFTFADPFEEYIGKVADQDRRVGVIKPVLDSLMKDHDQYEWDKIYKTTNELWKDIENATEYRLDSELLS